MFTVTETGQHTLRKVHVRVSRKIQGPSRRPLQLPFSIFPCVSDRDTVLGGPDMFYTVQCTRTYIFIVASSQEAFSCRYNERIL
jgi:hypothetical protein